MADRVHPAPLLPLSNPPTPPPDSSHDASAETAPLRRPTTAVAPPPGTSYIVHVPKDQVLRVPPPDRARRYSKLAARPAQRRRLRRACCGACCAFFLLLALAVAFVGAVYLVFRPRAPSFSVASLSIDAQGLILGNATSSPVRIDAAVRADNGANRKVGVDYRGGGEVTVSYSGVQLATGRWPAFYQAPRNVTLVSMPLTGGEKGGATLLTDDQKGSLAAEAAAGAVPLTVEARVPVRVRLGKVLRTWTVDVWARCEVTVDRLAGQAAAANKGCTVKVKPLWWWW
ncbi:unnamed protein product [Alopecurus aequalis]